MSCHVMSCHVMLCMYTVIYISFIFHVVGKIPGSSRLQWRAPLLPAPGWAWSRGPHGAMGHGQHQGGSLGLRHEQPMTLVGMQDYIYILGILYVMVYFSDFHIIGIFWIYYDLVYSIWMHTYSSVWSSSWNFPICYFCCRVWSHT